MSAKVQALIWEHYDPDRFGAPLVMALALGDESDDRGGGIFQSKNGLAKKTRQHQRQVSAQMRRMEASGFLRCVNRSAGGVGKFSEYSLNLGLLFEAENHARGAGLTLLVEQGSVDQNHARGAGFESSPISIGTSGTSSTHRKDVLDVDSSRVSADLELRRLAEWMFGLLVRLNPKVKKPQWSAWCRDLRFMVQRDKHTTREIAELFKFANEHSFWQSNIESPGKLRKQWNRLLLERQKAGPAAAAAKAIDTRCAHVQDGERCASTHTTSDATDGSGPYFCWEHRGARERARVGAGATAHG